VYSCLYEPNRQIQHLCLSLLGRASWCTTGRLIAELLSPHTHSIACTLICITIHSLLTHAGDYFDPMFVKPMVALRPLHYSAEVR
jgi:hypothetical protein